VSLPDLFLWNAQVTLGKAKGQAVCSNDKQQQQKQKKGYQAIKTSIILKNRVLITAPMRLSFSV
jgi:hypothetical protein